MGFFSKFLNAFKSINLNDKNAVSGEQLNHLLVSAMYAEQQSAYLNSYETGLSKADVKKMVEEYWEVFDKNEAIEILEDLQRRNEDVYMQVVYNAIEDKANYVNILKSGLPSEEAAFNYYLDSYRNSTAVIADLIEEKVIKDFSELKVIRDSAWNYGRSAYLSRCFYELGYLSETETKQYLEKAYHGLKNYCGTWKEYTISYIYGRAIWGGPNNSGMVQIAEDLLNNEKSPLKNKIYI